MWITLTIKMAIMMKLQRQDLKGNLIYLISRSGDEQGRDCIPHIFFYHIDENFMENPLE